ncbi:hypothetical protein [Immundisolibacter sp.]
MKTEADRIVEHLLRHKEYAMQVINYAYPFNADELRKFSDKLDWEFISMNSNIKWTEALYEEFKSMININALEYCSSFPWTEEFIDKHMVELFYSIDSEGEIEKSGFASNIGLPWSERFIDKYAEHWDWMWLSMNESIPFSIEMLDKYADKWDYDSLEFNKRIVKDETLKSYLNIFYDKDVREYFHRCEFCFKGEEIMEEYSGKSITTDICTCPNFNWMDGFASKLRKKLKHREGAERIARAIRWEDFNHWSIDVLDAFEEFWDYDVLWTDFKLTDYIGISINHRGILDAIINNFYEFKNP